MLPSRLSKLFHSSIHCRQISSLWKLEAEPLEELPIRSVSEMIRLQIHPEETKCLMSNLQWYAVRSCSGNAAGKIMHRDKDKQPWYKPEQTKLQVGFQSAQNPTIQT